MHVPLCRSQSQPYVTCSSSDQKEAGELPLRFGMTCKKGVLTSSHVASRATLAMDALLVAFGIIGAVLGTYDSVAELIRPGV